MFHSTLDEMTQVCSMATAETPDFMKWLDPNHSVASVVPWFSVGGACGKTRPSYTAHYGMLCDPKVRLKWAEFLDSSKPSESI